MKPHNSSFKTNNYPPTISPSISVGAGGQFRSPAMATVHRPRKNNANTNNNNLRFLGFTKKLEPEPDSNPNGFEFDESDVIWSSSDVSDTSDTHSPPTLSSSPTNPRRHYQHHNLPFHSDKSGLSAALTDDHHPLVRRKSALNPSLSAATAARTIPPVPLARYEGTNGAKFHQSAPMNVPIWPKKNGEIRSRNLDEIEDDCEDEEEMVPPHEIVARSHVTFSVFEGVGRTLKGRDLRRVRNAVFQQTEVDWPSGFALGWMEIILLYRGPNIRLIDLFSTTDPN